ncbi:MAG: hypothetical protein II919_03420 [Lachnospiraceae bacterium]|nr:hypothetical protein [Lachnospiraceae bacterium]
MKKYPHTIIETEDSIYEYDEECMKCIKPHPNEFMEESDDNLFTLLVCVKYAESYLSSDLHIL